VIARESINKADSISLPLAALLQTASLEATLPKSSELSEIREQLPQSTPIFVSAPPGCAHQRLLDAAKMVRLSGFEPVPHIAARSFASLNALDDFLRAIAEDSGVSRALVIAGDLDQALGPFPGAGAIIDSDLLQYRGIYKIAIAGYPDGHTKLSEGILRRSLVAKLNTARARDLKVAIVTQFCFDVDKIASWITSIRASGLDVPIRIGVAGPASATGLARFALRCGVRNSVKAVLSGKASQFNTEIAPEEVIAKIAAECEKRALGEIATHFYSFGGLVRTARWIGAHAGYGAAHRG
jgi:methylenetetrahydrofolate reductase (NADPH)